MVLYVEKQTPSLKLLNQELHNRKELGETRTATLHALVRQRLLFYFFLALTSHRLYISGLSIVYVHASLICNLEPLALVLATNCIEYISCIHA